ncbi:MAG: LOG family protein [Acidimicrobiia bacterium]
MRNYRLGDKGLDDRLAALVADAVDGHGDHDHDEDLVAEMLVSGLKLLRDDTDRGDLKLVNSALKEMRYSFVVFSKYREIPKVTIYGSARTPPDHPNYALARDFANTMADRHGWMIITGAGPGIMEAGNKGAGHRYGFGVNIRLPFEADANEFVDDSRLINFKYFFTRKLIFVKESDAFALFPGGFGTQDETFELLTLIQTGKSDMHPVVLLEAPGTGYWERWLELVGTLEKQGMITPDDRSLFLHTSNVAEACDEILGFYRNYHSQRYVEGRLVLRLRNQPGDALVAAINEEYSDILTKGTFERIGPTDAELADGDNVDLSRLRFTFDRRHHGRLRQLINTLNESVGENGTSSGR